MRAALESNGIVAGVLADSLLRSLRQPANAEAVADGRVCLCTPYAPAAGFSVGRAMGRNQVIDALAAATRVVATGERSGGPWAGAQESAKQPLGPGPAWTGAGARPGTRQLVSTAAAEIAELDERLPLRS